jgi:indolepyruvate ferredoxin oxidoreductase beta subunit
MRIINNESHERREKVWRSPIIPQGKADLVIAFEPGEAVRNIGFLAPSGTLVVCDKPVMPTIKPEIYKPDEMITWLKSNIIEEKLVIVDGEAVSKAYTPRSLNIALLGIAMKSVEFPFTLEQMETALKNRLPEKYWEVNLRALNASSRGCPT